jgi:uncharacterized protein YecE (DUF72 family)
LAPSGYNYPEWKGSFYPADLATAKMLPYYAARFPTVEINYTFYRMPNEKLASGWAAQTPSPYKLTLKAPRRITHDSRLKNCGDLVHAFCGVAGTLGDKLGALLFQLPPNLKKDLALFDAFLGELPPKVTAAFEFRNVSWLDDEVFGRLPRAISRCASPTARSCRRRSESPRTTRTSACATRATPPTTSRAGPTPSRATRPPAATCSSISSTRKRGKAPSSPGR